MSWRKIENAETVVPWNKSETTTDTWRAECGLTLENNQYYTSNVRREPSDHARLVRLPTVVLRRR